MAGVAAVEAQRDGLRRVLTCPMTGRSPAPPAVACSHPRVYPRRDVALCPIAVLFEGRVRLFARSRWVEHASRELSQGPQNEGGWMRVYRNQVAASTALVDSILSRSDGSECLEGEQAAKSLRPSS